MNPKPLLYDVYCGCGGCTVGYQRAGFRVIGVDLVRHKNYPGEGFVQMDAFEFFKQYLAGKYEAARAFHASPPCQHWTALRRMWNSRDHEDLIPLTRAFLRATELPYIIENVPGAPLIDPVRLCGSMFGLGCDGAELRRHRLFETSFPVMAPKCHHRDIPVIGVYGGHGRNRRRSQGQSPDWTLEQRQQAMGIDWMNGNELSQAIPPAYTQFLGERLMEVVCAAQ